MFVVLKLKMTTVMVMVMVMVMKLKVAKVMKMNLKIMMVILVGGRILKGSLMVVIGLLLLVIVAGVWEGFDFIYLFFNFLVILI